MPCCLRLLAIRVAPSTSLMLSSSDRTTSAARLRIDGRTAKGFSERKRLPCAKWRHGTGGGRLATGQIDRGATRNSTLMPITQGQRKRRAAFAGRPGVVAEGAAPRALLG